MATTNERQRMPEFGNEGIFKYDLLRWSLLGTIITETRAGMTAWASATATNHPSFTSYTCMKDGPAYARDAAQLPTYLLTLK